MPDPVSRQKHKKRVLDRWENEGGMIPAALNKPLGSGSTAECSNRDDGSPPPKARGSINAMTGEAERRKA